MRDFLPILTFRSKPKSCGEVINGVKLNSFVTPFHYVTVQ